MVGTEKFQDNYELKFLRVPISDPNVSNYIDDKSLRRSYDNITNQDPFWDGISKSDILSEEDKGFYHLQKNYPLPYVYTILKNHCITTKL